MGPSHGRSGGQQYLRKRLHGDTRDDRNAKSQKRIASGSRSPPPKRGDQQPIRETSNRRSLNAVNETSEPPPPGFEMMLSNCNKYTHSEGIGNRSPISDIDEKRTRHDLKEAKDYRGSRRKERSLSHPRHKNVEKNEPMNKVLDEDEQQRKFKNVGTNERQYENWSLRNDSKEYKVEVIDQNIKNFKNLKDTHKSKESSEKNLSTQERSFKDDESASFVSENVSYEKERNYSSGNEVKTGKRVKERKKKSKKEKIERKKVKKVKREKRERSVKQDMEINPPLQRTKNANHLLTETETPKLTLPVIENFENDAKVVSMNDAKITVSVGNENFLNCPLGLEEEYTNNFTQKLKSTERLSEISGQDTIITQEKKSEESKENSKKGEVEDGSQPKKVLPSNTPPAGLSRFDSVLDIHGYDTDFDDTNVHTNQKNVKKFPDIPALSKWELEEQQPSTQQSDDVLMKNHPTTEANDSKVSSDIIRKAEHAIFARAINAIRPLDSKKLETESIAHQIPIENSTPAALNRNVESAKATLKDFQVTIPSGDIKERCVEFKAENTVNQVNNPQKLKLSIRDRLGSKIVSNKRISPQIEGRGSVEKHDTARKSRFAESGFQSEVQQTEKQYNKIRRQDQNLNKDAGRRDSNDKGRPRSHDFKKEKHYYNDHQDRDNRHYEADTRRKIEDRLKGHRSKVDSELDRNRHPQCINICSTPEKLNSERNRRSDTRNLHVTLSKTYTSDRNRQKEIGDSRTTVDRYVKKSNKEHLKSRHTTDVGKKIDVRKNDDNSLFSEDNYCERSSVVKNPFRKNTYVVEQQIRANNDNGKRKDRSVSEESSSYNSESDSELDSEDAKLKKKRKYKKDKKRGKNSSHESSESPKKRIKKKRTKSSKKKKKSKRQDI